MEISKYATHAQTNFNAQIIINAQDIINHPL